MADYRAGVKMLQGAGCACGGKTSSGVQQPLGKDSKQSEAYGRLL
jgi:hypothetical protein